METEIINGTIQNSVGAANTFPIDLIETTIVVIASYIIALFVISILKFIIKTIKRMQKKCSCCGNMYRYLEGKTYNKKNYCMRCYKRNFNVCDICEHVVEKKLYNFHRKNLCNKCRKTKIIKCKECKKLYGKWEMRYHNFNYLCERCYEIIVPRMFETIKFLQTKVIPTTFDKNKFDRYCGVEIECRNRHRDKNCFTKSQLKELKYSQCRDGSINSGGVEFVSRPMNGDNLFNSIKSFCKILTARKYFVDKSCGLHIHLEVPKKVDYLKNIYLFYKKFEPLMFNMVPKSRQRTEFCDKYKSYYSNTLQELFKIKTLDEFKSMVYETKSKYRIKDLSSSKYNDKRYCWINFHSIFFRGTLEVRNHSGTISSKKINNWLLLHLTILDFLSKIDIDTINELKVDKKTFLSIFPSNIKMYIKERWDKFENSNKEERD